jgi:D-3-phosphoglycerate dehydrogenase
MVLDLTRKITANSNKVKSGTWGLGVPLAEILTLKYMTVGVVGFGRIGREVAGRLKAFKCTVLVYDPPVDPAVIRLNGCEPASLDDIFRKSDLITLHCPSNDHTKQMINAQSISIMKDGVLLVNSSRGTLVKTDDLVAALKSHKISAVALDVTDPEPPDLQGELVKLDNVIINSHIASCSVQAVKKLRDSVVSIALTATRGESLPNIVNGVKGS